MNSTEQYAVVTGGSDGIGRATAERLSGLGMNVIIVGRNPAKGQRTMYDLNSQFDAGCVTYWQADLSLMREVDRLAERLHTAIPRLDVLVHCAGVMLPERVLTAEGLETVFAVQYLARYALSHAVIDLLKRDDGTMVNVSAGGSVNMALDFENLNGEKHYSGVTALMHESIANDMLTIDLNEQHPDVRAYCYGPGYVRTTLMRDMPAWLRFFSATGGRVISIAPERAADEILRLITEKPANGLHGRLYSRTMKHFAPAGFRADAGNRARLREASDRLIAGARVL